MTEITKQRPSLLTGSLSADQISLLAVRSPCAAFVATLTTTASQRGMVNAIVLAATVLAPGAVPNSTGRGRGGNLSVRFVYSCAIHWWQLDAKQLGSMRSELIQRKVAPATLNLSLAGVRGILKHCWLQGLLNGDVYQRSIVTLSCVKNTCLPRGRHISIAELQKLVVACLNDDSHMGIRDRALIALLYSGLRRSEVAGVNVSDYDQNTGQLIVRGKGPMGGKKRIVWLTNGKRVAFEQWILLRGVNSDAAFVQIRRGSHTTNDRMSPQAIYNAVLRRGREAGVQVEPHDLRRSMVSNLLQAGADIAIISKICGHSGIAVTQKYDVRDLQHQMRAMELAPLPLG